MCTDVDIDIDMRAHTCIRTFMYVYRNMCISIYMKQIGKNMAQNISTYKHIKTIISSFYSHFNGEWRYVMCFFTLNGQSNVLRLIKVFTVTDLPIKAFSLYVYVYLNLCNFLYIYIYIYTHTHTHTHTNTHIHIHIHIHTYIYTYTYIYEFSLYTFIYIY